jgi:putative glutathione S-transferase
MPFKFIVAAFAFLSVVDGFQLPKLSHGHDSSTSRHTARHAERLDKGFRLLELASGVVPQGALVKGAREGLRFIWNRMMAELAPQDPSGAYKRPSYSFQRTIGEEGFVDEPGRYHLYAGNPCPWCQRCVLAINTLNYSDKHVGMTRLEDNPFKASRGGWVFSDAEPDPLGSFDLRELYDKLEPGYQGRCTAPLLVDKKTRRIVSNESAHIVRMLNKVSLGTDTSTRIDLYPDYLAQDIDAVNEWVYTLVNDGVYKCGFATTQEAYDRASAGVRDGLARCETILATSPFLCGAVFTEADLRLLPTILRYDGAYAPLFKAGGAHLRISSNYPAIHEWLRRCWSMPGVKQSIDIGDATSSYFRQLFPLNPGGIIPSLVSPKALGLDG